MPVQIDVRPEARPTLGKKRPVPSGSANPVDHSTPMRKAAYKSKVGDVHVTLRFHSIVPRSFGATTIQKTQPVTKPKVRLFPQPADHVARLIDSNKKRSSSVPTKPTVPGKVLQKTGSFANNAALNPMRFSGTPASSRPSTPPPQRSSVSNFFTNDTYAATPRGRRRGNSLPPAERPTTRVLVPPAPIVKQPPSAPAPTPEYSAPRGVRYTIEPFVAAGMAPRTSSPAASAASERRAERWKSSILSSTPKQPDGSCIHDFSLRAACVGKQWKRGSVIAPPQPSGLAPSVERGRSALTLLDSPMPHTPGGKRHQTVEHATPARTGRRASPGRSASCGPPQGAAAVPYSPATVATSRKNIGTFQLNWA
jgi:hypothetical protein